VVEAVKVKDAGVRSDDLRTQVFMRGLTAEP
jgi:hypothetical protein